MCLTRNLHQMHIRGMTLAEYRAAHGINQSEFARAVGVSHTTVSRWESGDVAPTLEAMRRIATATGHAVMPNDWLNAAAAA